jgi:ABC-type phosphate/phosphonate transport system substrate-binding protein
MYNTYRPVLQAVESNELIFARVGPASFLELLERGGINLLAMQDHKTPLTLAIFTRKGSDVARRYQANTNITLSELLKNTRLGLGDTNSTTGYHVSCWYFHQNGMVSTNFASIANFAGQDRVRKAVLDRTVDEGAGNLDLIDDDPELLVVAKYPIPGKLGLCWVAGKKMDRTIAEQLRSCLLEMKDLDVLGKLESEVIGFKTLDPSAIEKIREKIRDEFMSEPKPFFTQ